METLVLLRAAQAGLRSRFDDFRQALGRRDGPAYRMALADFQQCLTRWTAAQEKALLPALDRASLPGRDCRRELTLEHVQLRELTRQVRIQIDSGAPIADVLGLVENLARRLEAHERGLGDVYHPAAAAGLTPDEEVTLREAARDL